MSFTIGEQPQEKTRSQQLESLKARLEKVLYLTPTHNGKQLGKKRSNWKLTDDQLIMDIEFKDGSKDILIINFD